MKQVSSTALSRADRTGFAVSVLCALHCAMLPLLVALLPAFGLKFVGFVDIDQAVVVFATLLGATTLTLGWRRHRAFRAWLFLLVGLALVWAGAFTHLHDHGLMHAMLMTLGGLLIAAAHLANLKLTHAIPAIR